MVLCNDSWRSKAQTRPIATYLWPQHTLGFLSRIQQQVGVIFGSIPLRLGYDFGTTQYIPTNDEEIFRSTLCPSNPHLIHVGFKNCVDVSSIIRTLLQAAKNLCMCNQNHWIFPQSDCKMHIYFGRTNLIWNSKTYSFWIVDSFSPGQRTMK